MNLQNQLTSTKTNLFSTLETIEQKCQEIRWRVDYFPDAESIGQLETDIGSLTGHTCLVSRFYGELEVLTDLLEAMSDGEQNKDGQAG